MELLKVLLAGVIALLASTPGCWILRRFNFTGTRELYYALGSLIGMGVVGTLYGFLFLIPGAVSPITIAAVSVLLAVLTGLSLTKRPKLESLPKDKGQLLALGIFIVCLIPLVGVLTPSTSYDWDSLAYHLAVPKIWVQQGHAGPISFIHHSNFPASVDSWFVVGELIGGQTASKAFVWIIGIVGAQTISCFLRERFSVQSGLLATLAFVSIPMVMWESGTAYIDVANGLFAGFGFVFAAQYVEKRERSDLWTAAILLSLAAGSKYTGLQAIVLASLVVLLMIDKAEKVSSFKLGLGAFALASPWYIKNWILVGNPVYPFFYSVLGGKNWDAFQGQIYTEEQKTFGFQGAMNLGQSIMGLVTSPGRFTNPQPGAGNGFAFVSLGFAVVAGAIVGIVKGLTSKFDKALALMILLQLLAWFALSQQSRYILTLVVPMLYFVAKALDWKPLGKFVMGAIALQALATLWVYKESILAERLPVLVGGLTRDEFLGGYKLEDGTAVPGKVDTYGLSKIVDQDPTVQKVALYDEVFGYYLNKPYFWASPGHTTEMGYADMKTADELIAAFKRLGVTHVYLNNRYLRSSQDEFDVWNRVAGIGGTPGKYTPEERTARMGDQRTKWRVLLAEAIAAKKLTVHAQFSATRFLFKIE